MKNHISVIGLGYVGLPLAIAAAQSGFNVNGVDISEDVIEKIRLESELNKSEFGQELNFVLQKKLLSLGTDFATVKDSDVILVCVPTPLTSKRNPDLSLVESAIISISRHLSKNSLIILESSVAPGTTRDFIAPLIAKYSGLLLGDFFLAYSPERVDPANKSWNIKNTPKLVSGLCKRANELTYQFYSHFISDIIICESLEVAEAAKLLENSFRLINISFINELSIFCEKMGIDVSKVVHAASSKPYGFMPFFPSIGVGGHCIPVDPVYLSNKADELGAPMELINLALKINHARPEYFVDVAEKKLGKLAETKILIIGVSYKPNVKDTRETPVKQLIVALRQRGAIVFWHDNLVVEWNSEKSVPISAEYDLAILATPHDYIDLSGLKDVPMINTRESLP